MITIILMILLMCILIVPHEFGHFITAKLLGVQVNEFSVGMGPQLFQKQKGETKYSIRLFPLGGFCAMEGENEESDNPRAFNNKPAWAKLIVLFAGAFMNILIAVIIMTSIVTYTGVATNTIGTVDDKSPAYNAGLEAGDRIVEVNGSETKSWKAVIEAMSVNEDGSEVSLSVIRDGKEESYTITPQLSDDGRYVIGIRTKPSHNIFRCTIAAVQETWYLNRQLLNSFISMFTNGVDKDDVAGPVGMASLVSETSKIGVWNYLYLVALISLNLAIINLLPFPALDGGRVLFVIIRKITGNMITDDIEGYVHAFGMIILILLFVIITWNDITRLLLG